MIFKKGVSYARLSAEAWRIAYVADQLHQEMAGRQVVITSTTEGKHRVARSAHYRGDAVDLRRWYTDAQGNTASFVNELQRRLGADCVVIEEKTHVHAHWSPIYHDERDPLAQPLRA